MLWIGFVEFQFCFHHLYLYLFFYNWKLLSAVYLFCCFPLDDIVLPLYSLLHTFCLCFVVAFSFHLCFRVFLAWEQFNDVSSLLREKNERWLPDWQTGRPSLIAPQKQQLIHTFTCCSPRSIHEKKYYYTFYILIQPISSYELNSFTAFITFHQQNKWVCYFYFYSMSAKTRESLKLIAIRLGKQNQFSFLFLVLLSSSYDSFKNI